MEKSLLADKEIVEDMIRRLIIDLEEWGEENKCAVNANGCVTFDPSALNEYSDYYRKVNILRNRLPEYYRSLQKSLLRLYARQQPKIKVT